MKSYIFFILSFSIFSQSNLLAVEIEFKTPNELALTGSIVQGDAGKLSKRIRNSTEKEFWITVDSPGGDIEESIKMAEILKSLYPSIKVSRRGICASSCFFIWLSGTPRYAFSPETAQALDEAGNSFGVVGLHRPYFKPTEKPDERQQKLMSMIRRYLELESVPGRIIDAMMARPSNDIYWLTDEDIEELGKYRPSVEEFLVAQCNMERKNPSTAEILNGKSNYWKKASCQNQATSLLHQRALVKFKTSK